MKKLLLLAALTGILFTTGCETASELLRPEEVDEPVASTTEMGNKPVYTHEDEVAEPQSTIPCTQTLRMTNEWTVMGSFNHTITNKEGKEDRVILSTSALHDGEEMLWDDSQYWTLAVIAADGAYNLFSERMQGQVFAEVNEGFINGITTTVITAYIFSNADREIRNYVYDSEEDVFIEYQEYTTKNFSTGGINNLYTTVPEYKPW